ncbi:hypothetical protein K502DRAFT_302585 [Neoconidiobolus thromboides FSU 785]|nr:hypothetical protein K502DRAFT_302585 [Neoconidiobolus thromboides FSU 785]
MYRVKLVNFKNTTKYFNFRSLSNLNNEPKIRESVVDICALNYDDLFSPSSISAISKRLSISSSQRPAFRFKYDKTQIVSEASVLMLLCSVDKVPSVLFTVRTKNLSSHPGEISFPGGKRDESDDTLLATCLRETYEEIGIPSDLIHILGQYSPLPNWKGNLKVYPYVGIILKELNHCGNELKIHTESVKGEENLLDLKLNKDEVDNYFTIPINDLLKKESIETWDSPRGSPNKVPRYRTPEYIDGTIWGLTGFILHGVLEICFKERYLKS